MQPRDSKILHLTIVLILMSVAIPQFLGVSVIVLGFDPFSFILRYIDCDSPNNVAVFIAKCFLLSYLSHIGWFGICSVIVLIVIQLHYGSFLINKGLYLVNELSKTLMSKENKKRRVRVSYHQYQKQLRIIREVLCTIKFMRIILPLVDEGLYIILPFMLLFGEVILVCCNYATIKMYYSIPMPFFLTVPCLSVFAVVMAQFLFPLAASFFENSKKSLELLKSLKIVATNKEWIRSIRATRPPRFNVGSMFYPKRRTKTTYFNCCLNDTISSIILIK